MRRLPSKSKSSLLILIALFAALAGVLVERQPISDWFKLRNYTPPSAIAQLSTDDTMTSYARHVFYVNHPAIDSKADFNVPCKNDGGEQTIVLGCYHSNQNGIFLLDVSDPRLNGVEQVTAAHEMLHAAYDRLSSSERSKVDAMLLDYYNHDLHDPRLISTINAYKKTEPKDVVNEMHSVFGTEVADLPSGLEDYYKRYFTNRAQITTYAAQYEEEFTSRQTTVNSDDAQLAGQKSEIDTQEADLKTKYAMIMADQDSLNSERSTNPSAYNAAVPGYNDEVNDYNEEVADVKGFISQYNQLVSQRNAVAFEENQLSNDLISNLNTVSN